MATRIPVNKDSGFEDRQKKIWEDIEADMERRRREWEGEVDKMRKEFFLLRPAAGAPGIEIDGGVPGVPPEVQEQDSLGPRNRLLETSSDESRGMVVKDEKGNPMFKVQFDVHDYRPDEVSVKMDDHKIMVSARHQTTQGGASVSREYNREVKIPSELDPMSLQCIMGSDGILTVEALIPAPSYAAVLESLTSMPKNTAFPGHAIGSNVLEQQAFPSTSSSSYQTSHISEPSNPASVSGITPVSAPFQNSSPVMFSEPPAPPSFPQQPQHISSVAMYPTQPPQGISSSTMPGFTMANNTPFQSLPGQQTGAPSYNSTQQWEAGGRIGSPVLSSDPSKFKLEIDIEDFSPEELTVKTQDKRVLISAKREEKVGNRSSTRELNREHTIPDTVDPLTIKAFFTDGGKLIVEAPYRDGHQQCQMTGR